MSVAFDRKQPWTLVSFLFRRIGQDLQFSGIFLCDFVAALAYTLATLYLLHEVELPVGALIEMAILALLIVAAQAAKIVGVILLEKCGGDAREFIGSKTLVTHGAYAFSRNPVYLVAIVQSGLWSLLLLRGELVAPIHPLLILAALVFLVGHFLGVDRLIIPNEEAALKSAHPEAFAAYANRVNRWLGWRRT